MQFSMSTQFYFKLLCFAYVHNLVLFNPQIRPNRVLPRLARMDMGAMAVKGYSVFPKALASPESHYQIVYSHKQDTR